MRIVREGFVYIISDNQETYFRHLEGIVSSLDQYASISVSKKPEGIQVRITPSDYQSLIALLSEVKKVHMLFGLVIDFSKSMKSSNNICYNINF